MREQMAAAVRSSPADYTEIRLEDRQSSRVVFRGRELETASVVIDRGGIVRCLVQGGGWGVATFNNLDDLPRRVRQAYEGARSLQAEPIEQFLFTQKRQQQNTPTEVAAMPIPFFRFTVKSPPRIGGREMTG